jgi:hypothetical protein
MRLCAHAQPAHIRMTRRRSALPLPSSSISELETPYGCSEDNDDDNDSLKRLDKGRSISAARAAHYRDATSDSSHEPTTRTPRGSRVQGAEGAAKRPEPSERQAQALDAAEHGVTMAGLPTLLRPT